MDNDTNQLENVLFQRLVRGGQVLERILAHVNSSRKCEQVVDFGAAVPSFVTKALETKREIIRDLLKTGTFWALSATASFV